LSGMASVVPFSDVRNVPSPNRVDIINSISPTGGTSPKYLTESEMERLLTAAKHGRHGIRDYALLLLGYRHGLRASELVEMRLDALSLETAHVWVQRLKGSLSTQHRLEGPTLRAVRRWLDVRTKSRWTHLPWLFVSERGAMSRKAVNYLIETAAQRAGLPVHVHPHMLRHSCGYALANKGVDTRLIQDYLGHRNIQHTVRYTATAAKRFERIWD
jgi:type 1 fimbriae regulatory protein FimB